MTAPAVSADPRPRSRSALHRAVPMLAPLAAAALPWWATGATVLIGGPGPRYPVMVLALSIPLLLLQAVAAILMLREAASFRPRRASARCAWVALGSWICLAALGPLLPMRLDDGRTVSLLTAGVPGASAGLSAGFANTLGVLAVAGSAALVLCAIADLRRTSAARRGEPVELSEEEEEARREAWLASFRQEGPRG